MKSFTEEDKELLKKVLPKNPCDYCWFYKNGGCCGCPQHREYLKIIKPYKDNNILGIAYEIKKYYDTVEVLKKTKEKLANILKEIPEEIVKDVLDKVEDSDV